MIPSSDISDQHSPIERTEDVYGISGANLIKLLQSFITNYIKAMNATCMYKYKYIIPTNK